MASKSQNQHHLLSSIRFFKIILKTNLEPAHLKIPNKFTRKYGSGLPNPVFLKPRDGTEWKVHWTKNDAEILFKEGWNEFATYYSLDHGHLVVFEYKRNSDYFDVQIFDTSAVEINYPFRGTQDEQDNCNEIGDDHGDDGRNYIQQNMSKHVQQDNSDQISDNDSIEILDDPPPYQKFRKNSPMSCRQPCKKLRNGTTGYDGRSSNLQNMPQHDPIQENNYGTTECQNVGQEDLTFKIAEALNRATTFQSKTTNPSFMVVLNHSYVNQDLHIQAQFAKKHLKGKQGNILPLVLDGKTWTVTYNFGKFCNGWMEFVSDNDLNVGDVCLFELIKSKGLSLKARIFRVEPHSPLKSKTMNPSFRIVLSFSYVNGKSLYIPLQFAKKYLKGKEGDILFLVLDGKSWPVKYIFKRFRDGWTKFVFDNHLKVGDVCVFELIKSQGHSLKARIFHVSEESHSPPPPQGDGVKEKDPVRISDVESKGGKATQRESIAGGKVLSSKFMNCDKGAH